MKLRWPTRRKKLKSNGKFFVAYDLTVDYPRIFVPQIAGGEFDHHMRIRYPRPNGHHSRATKTDVFYGDQFSLTRIIDGGDLCEQSPGNAWLTPALQHTARLANAEGEGARFKKFWPG